jgi:hypothetical protein
VIHQSRTIGKILLLNSKEVEALVMKMFLKTFNPLCAVAIAGLIVGVVMPVSAKIITNVPPDISSLDIKAVVVEDFEGDLSGWKADTTPRKFKTTDAAKAKKDPVISSEIKAIKGAPSDLVPEKWSSDNKGTKKEQCLGLHFQFRYPGNNSVAVIPPAPIRLPGRVKALSMWVHGRGKEISLEAIIKDYEGNSHILKFGSLNFVGWKPVKVTVPENIPQSVESFPQTKTLVIERFIVRVSPNENLLDDQGYQQEAFLFFDQMKVLTESFEVNFDGQELDKAFKGGEQQKPQQGGQQTPSK